MDNSLINLVFISYLVFGANAKVTVKVSNDLYVKPTPARLTDVTDVVNVTLRCEGSSPDLAYYIRNRVSWTFISATGKQLTLTEGFYETQDAKHLFSGTQKRFACSHVKTEKGYAFDIHMTKVARSDEGIYRCSLKTDGGYIIDSKDVKLTVVNPVQTVEMELYDGLGNLVAESTSPVIQSTQSVNIRPGQYIVKCVASGSNPAPVMDLFLNELKPYVDIKKSEDNSLNFKSYIGVFANNLTISNKNSLQELVCKANIPGGFYASSEAGIVLLAHSAKLTVVCENTTAALADRNCLINCTVTEEGQIGALRCDGISWSFGMTGGRIGYKHIRNNQNNGYGDMESTCVEREEGLSVTLNIFTVTSKVFEGSLLLVYEYGAQNVSYSVKVYETVAVYTTMPDSTVTRSVTVKAPVDTAAVLTPLSLSVYLVVFVTASFTL